MTTKLFGEPVRRREDARLITGRGRYLDDIGAGALAAAFVRSPHAHARVVDVDVEAGGAGGRRGGRVADHAHPPPHPAPRPPRPPPPPP
ncbi:hypothetical protein ACI798_22325, partial [Geodermatophilus sp. SYSU D01045]